MLDEALELLPRAAFWLSNGANLARSTTFTTNFSDANGAATGNRWFVRDIVTTR